MIEASFKSVEAADTENSESIFDALKKPQLPLITLPQEGEVDATRDPRQEVEAAVKPSSGPQFEGTAADKTVCDPSTTAQSPQATAPSGARITVDVQASAITLDGTIHHNISAKGILLVKALVEAGGEWINGTAIVKKVSRVKAGLPKAIRDLIESQTGAGTRIPLSKLTTGLINPAN